MRTLSMADPGSVASPARMVLSAMCASLLGIGLSRFAYTPLLPELVASHWFSASDAAYLGAANLAGYLAGALLARPLAARLTPVGAMRAMMALAAASFFACAFPVSFLWFFGWRVLSGVSGGVLMVLVAPTILPHIPESRRGLAGGIIFAGVGAGIALSGTLVPLLLQAGLVRTWLGLGVLAVALAALAWGGWPPAEPVATRRVRFVAIADAGDRLPALRAERGRAGAAHDATGGFRGARAGAGDRGRRQLLGDLRPRGDGRADLGRPCR
jgi:MFS family permease